MPDEIISELLDMFGSTMIYEPPLTPDESGDVPFGPPITIPVRFVGGHKPIRDRTGREQMSTVRAWCAGIFDLDIDGRFTLPSPHDPSQPEAIDVRVIDDENGPHHEVVFF